MENKQNQTNRTEEEYKRELYKISDSLGMRENELFTNFMVKRFPHEKHISYIKEWAFRFMSGNPTVYMDTESKEIFLFLINGRV